MVSGAAVVVQIGLYLAHDIYSEWTPVVMLYAAMSYWSKVFMQRLTASGERMEHDLRKLVDSAYNPDEVAKDA